MILLGLAVMCWSVRHRWLSRANARSPRQRKDPVKLVLDVPVAADPGGQGFRARAAVAGDEVNDLDGFLAVPGDRAAQLRDLGGAFELDPGRCGHDFDRAAGSPAMTSAHGGDGGDSRPGQLSELPEQRRRVGLAVIT